MVLAAFKLVAGLIFHNFWNMPAAQQSVQQIIFMKNIAIADELLTLAAWGGRMERRRQASQPAADLSRPMSARGAAFFRSVVIAHWRRTHESHSHPKIALRMLFAGLALIAASANAWAAVPAADLTDLTDLTGLRRIKRYAGAALLYRDAVAYDELRFLSAKVRCY